MPLPFFIGQEGANQNPRTTQALRLKQKKSDVTVKLPEIVGLFVLFSLVVHLLTSDHVALWHMILAFALVIITIAGVFKARDRHSDSGRRLWAAIAALAAGFWIFSFFRYFGFVEWPMAHPLDFSGYLDLLYFQLVLSFTVLVPLFLVRHRISGFIAVTWGTWKKTGFGLYGLLFLLLSSLGLWLFAMHNVLVTTPSVTGPLAGLIIICLLKASLTGVTEEVCYRGILQPLSMTYIGIPLGIVFQSSLFTAFHMHLGAGTFSKGLFLGTVMALGLVFGVVTRLTSGVGWACVMHIAINVVIEWRNLS